MLAQVSAYAPVKARVIHRAMCVINMPDEMIQSLQVLAEKKPTLIAMMHKSCKTTYIISGFIK